MGDLKSWFLLLRSWVFLQMGCVIAQSIIYDSHRVVKTLTNSSNKIVISRLENETNLIFCPFLRTTYIVYMTASCLTLHVAVSVVILSLLVILCIWNKSLVDLKVVVKICLCFHLLVHESVCFVKTCNNRFLYRHTYLASSYFIMLYCIFIRGCRLIVILLVQIPLVETWVVDDLVFHS